MGIQGPQVAFVNQNRDELGLPQRDRYAAPFNPKTGIAKMKFSRPHINKKGKVVMKKAGHVNIYFKKAASKR